MHAQRPGYERSGIPTSPNDPIVIMADLLRGAQRVLEVGAGSGVLAQLLCRNGARVTGIEIDPDLVTPARQFFERVIIGDIEHLELQSILSGDRFDAVAFGDVLEHLQDPAAVIRSLLPFLREDGAIVASIPNIAHGAVRLSLIQGHFNYADWGLLDRNHVRFFTREGIRRLFEQVGMHVHTWTYVIRDPLETEISLDPQDLPGPILEYVREDPDAFVYQHIVEARRHPPTQAQERSVSGSENLTTTPPADGDAEDPRRLRSDLSQAYARIEALSHELQRLREWQARVLHLPGARLLQLLLGRRSRRS